MGTQTCHSPLVHPRPPDKYLRLIVSAQKLPPVTTAAASTSYDEPVASRCD